MQTHHLQTQRRARAAASLIAGLTLALFGAAAQAAEVRGTHAGVEARYQAERKACLEGRTGQDQATCLKEAGAARAEALRSTLDNGEDRATLQANALARCAAQPAGERPACELLARGQGMESGSVKDGGVIKEVVTRTVGRPAPAPESIATPANPPSKR